MYQIVGKILRRQSQMSPVFHLQGAHILVENRGNKKGDVFLKEEEDRRGFWAGWIIWAETPGRLQNGSGRIYLDTGIKWAQAQILTLVSLTHINDVEIV